MPLGELARMLHEGGYSCVVYNGEVRTFSGRGVADLYLLLKNEPEFLKGASVADKVVGKGAAALMVLGGVKELYAGVVSKPALDLLSDAGVKVSFGREVPQIRNRENTGFCPLESLCLDEDSAERILPLIDGFIRERMPDIYDRGLFGSTASSIRQR